MSEFVKKLEEYRAFAEDSRRRVNKLMAQNDPTYYTRYIEKRGLIQAQIQVLTHNTNGLGDKLALLKERRAKLLEALKKLDEDYREFEPM